MSHILVSALFAKIFMYACMHIQISLLCIYMQKCIILYFHFLKLLKVLKSILYRIEKNKSDDDDDCIVLNFKKDKKNLCNTLIKA